MTNLEIHGKIQHFKSLLNTHKEISDGMDSHFIEQMTTHYESQINDFQNMLKTARTPLPVCPHCGWEEIETVIITKIISAGDGKVKCDYCEEQYACTANREEQTFTTKKA